MRCSNNGFSKRNNAKLLVAVIGGSGVVAMGALSVAIASNRLAGARRQVGEHDRRLDSGRDTPPTVEATTMAVPSMKGPAPLARRRAGARRAVANPHRFHG